MLLQLGAAKLPPCKIMHTASDLFYSERKNNILNSPLQILA